ncbi:trypsin-like [Alligator sinensis]|uniref:trypsin n=1 Tax=Alligator sinensis TaxID=38654 RepID=A0A1U8DZR4_ALLSI|nr:trypsin-like [Alligator sinensis]
MELLILLLLSVAVAARPYQEDDGDRIISGYECQPHSQPWQVFFTHGDNYRWCGGALISPEWVISAAHCYKPTLVAHLGEHDTTAQEGFEQHIRAVKAIRFPKYNARTLDNDLMMVKLVQPAQIDPYVQPIRLSRSCPVSGTDCLVSGWGNLLTDGVQYPGRLQCLQVPILSESTCRSCYPGAITRNMFCAGYVQGGKDSCQGDSGGPLVCNGELTGVVSWGEGCAQKDKPGVYTTLCNYLPWIQEVMANN